MSGRDFLAAAAFALMFVIIAAVAMADPAVIAPYGLLLAAAVATTAVIAFRHADGGDNA